LILYHRELPPELNDEIKIFATSPIDPEFCESLLARTFRLENMRPSSRVAPPFFARELAGANPAMVYIGDRHGGSLAFGQCAVRIGFFAWCSAEGIQ
jgi:hypothetical protein